MGAAVRNHPAEGLPLALQPQADASNSGGDVAAALADGGQDIPGAGGVGQHGGDGRTQTDHAVVPVVVAAAHGAEPPPLGQQLGPPADAIHIDPPHGAVPNLHQLEALVILPQVGTNAAFGVVDADQRAVIPGLPGEPPHLLQVVGDEGAGKGLADSQKVHVPPVVGPLHAGNQGQTRNAGQGKILRVVVVIGHRQKVQAQLFCFFGQSGDIVLPIGGVGVNMEVAE